MATETIGDFSNVANREAAEALYAEGKLERILLFPSRLGGKDIPLNVVYVPKGISAMKDKITETLVQMFKDGKINKLAVDPEYKGASFIPSRIKIRAWHTDRKGEFNTAIEVW